MQTHQGGASANLLTGQAGVWQVASQLALRGMNPHFPGVDFGYDLTVDNGIRIQVKAGRIRKHHRVYPEGAYWFKLWQAPIVTGANNIKKRGARDYSKVCDFLVFWGIDENRFWVVPAPLVAKAQCIVLGPEGFHKRNSFDEAKALSGAGFSQSEIAERLGISQAAVSYQLRGGRKAKPKRTMTAIVREHENRWDLITALLATLNEANLAVAEPRDAAVPAST